MPARVAARVSLILAIAVSAAAFAAGGYTPPSADAFVKGIRSYPFVASAQRREKIRAGVPQLTRCMPSTEVRRIIGDPDFGYLAYRKGADSQVPSKHIWHYVLEKNARLETEPAATVVVWFDSHEKLQTVAVHGVRDIEPTISRRNDGCP